jgi:hypothetical protein
VPEAPRSHRVAAARPVRPRLVRALVAAALALAVLLTAVAVVPTLRAAAQAPFVLAGALGSPVPRPWAPSVHRYEDEVGGVTVDRYAPASSAPPLLVVPGAAQDGRDDSRVVSLATSLAHAGRDVVVPELTLYDQELDLDDVDRVVRVADALCPPGGGLVVLGFSYGGSLALVAAADERVAGCIDLVATFGAYADLVGVVQAAVTGTSVVDGQRHPWRAADESIARQLLQDAATQLVPAEQRDALRRALREQDPQGLPPGSRAVYRLVTAEDPAQVRALARRLPRRARELLQTLSPAAVADQVEAQVLAAHAVDDPAVPYAELLRLRAAFPHARTLTVESFRHVDFTVTDDVGTLLTDLLAAWGFVQGVLRPQEHWPWQEFRSRATGHVTGTTIEPRTEDVMADTTSGAEPGGGVEDDLGPGEQGTTYHGEGVGRREEVDSGPATGTPGHPHPPEVHVGHARGSTDAGGTGGEADAAGGGGSQNESDRDVPGFTG